MSHAAEGRRTSMQLLQEFSIPLIAGVVLAVLWANVDSHGYHHIVHWSPFAAGDAHGHGHGGFWGHMNLHFVMNDLFMALFFGLAAKEITEACLPGGALNPPQKAVNPLFGTVGGVVGPVAVYLVIASATGNGDIANGWGIPTATDIALAWLVARVVFGATHPAVSFLLLLAVADDGLGLGIIAIFYPDPENPVQPMFLLLVVAAALFSFALRKGGVKSFWPYLLAGGTLSWFGLFSAHLHPALALVPVVPFMPSADHDEGLYAEEGDGKIHDDTLNKFEHFFKLPVDIGLFGFGLANAGVEFSSVGAATWAVLGGLLIGKTIGIFGFSALAHAIGFKLPEGMDFKSLLVAGVTASLGLTVALFVAGVAFTEPVLQGSAKMGALFSAVAAPLVFVLGRVLRVKEGTAPAAGGGAEDGQLVGEPALAGAAMVRLAEGEER